METGKEIIVRDPNQSLSLQKVSDGLFASGLFPNAKNKYGAFAIVEYGFELGVPPMMALKNINIISGQLACNGQLMLSLAMQKGVTYEVQKEDDKGCKIVFHRQGHKDYTAEFTEKDAQAAGLLGKDNWKKYAKDMYFWRAVVKGIRRIAPDAAMGMYTPDEITEGKVLNVTDIPIDTSKAIEAELVAQPDDIPEPPSDKEIIAGLKKELSGMMKGFHTDEKKAFFSHVITGEPTVDNLQDFKDNFEDYRMKFMQSKVEAKQ